MPLSPDFRRLWTAQSISFFGSQVTELALPLTALVVLNASPTEMGVLVALENLPMACIGLVAGVWVDRMRRRPWLIACDFGRGSLLAAVPIAAALDALTFPLLCAVAFGAGSLNVCAAVADRAYLPSLVAREELIAANSRVQFSASVARTSGPGIAGLLVDLLTAPIALAVDALSFFVAGIFLLRIRQPEEKPTVVTRHVGREIIDGLRHVLRHPTLRPLVLCGGMHNLSSQMIVPLYVLYLTREFGVSPLLLGGILLTGGLGSIVGASASTRITVRWGVGRTLVFSQLLTGVARLAIPIAFGPQPWVLGWFIFSEFLLGAMRPIFNVTQISLRQAITAPEMQGRVAATIGFLLWGFSPIGALAGGFLGDRIGLRPTLAIAASGVLLSTGWVLFSQLGKVREVVPEATEHPTPASSTERTPGDDARRR